MAFEGGVVEWSSIPLSELTIAPATYGVVQPGHSTTDGVPMLRVNNFTGQSLDLSQVLRISPEIESKHERTRIKPGDVLVTIVGSVGKVAIASNELNGWNIARAVALIRPKEPALSRWISFVLRSPVAQHQLGVSANTTVQTTINLKDLRGLQIPMPSDRSRQEICEILGALDDRIDNLRQTNATLEAIAQVLFRSWFVDFDPVRAKTEGREPEGVDAATSALFPSDFEVSERGPIPKGWRQGTLADLSDLNASKWTARSHPATVKYVDLSSVIRNRIESVTEFSFDEAPSRARHRLREGDTVVGTVRPGNRAYAYIHAPESNLTGSTGFAVLSPRSQQAASFIYLGATHDGSIGRLSNLADGGAYPAVRPSVVAETPCVIPSNDTLRAFSELTKPLLECVAQNCAIAATLADLRDTLLPRLISGTLRLIEAEAAIEEARA